MSIQKVTIAMGVLIALSSGGAIMLTNRYQVSEPFEPAMFTRFDGWTGHAEVCSSYYDERTYCALALKRRIQQELDAEHEAAYQKFLAYGHTQEEIERWPAHVLDGARNIVLNGGSKDTLDKWIHEKAPSE
jgi:hypothetical protein